MQNTLMYLKTTCLFNSCCHSDMKKTVCVCVIVRVCVTCLQLLPKALLMLVSDTVVTV